MYKSKITKNADSSFYALVVRIDEGDDREYVCHGYTGRYFKTLKGAEKSTEKYIAKASAA